MRLLLLSNSTNYDNEFLAHARTEIRDFFNGKIRHALFFPYAAIRVSLDEYTKKVQAYFEEMNVTIRPIHREENPMQALQQAEAIIVGGGNTFQLLKCLQMNGYLEEIRYRVKQKGIPYIGWSAGANIACPTICTTNDMPVAEPESFNALNLIQFQINPHYLDWVPENFSGESRDARIREYCVLDPQSYVMGLREGSMVLIEDADIELLGSKPAKIFSHETDSTEVYPGEMLDFLF